MNGDTEGYKRYLSKDAERKKSGRTKRKEEDSKLSPLQLKDAIDLRKKEGKREKETSAGTDQTKRNSRSCSSRSTTWSTLSKAINRVEINMPSTPRRKQHVIRTPC